MRFRIMRRALVASAASALLWGCHASDSMGEQPAGETPRIQEQVAQAAPLEEPFRVLLLGDSISIGYTQHVQRILEGRALVVRPTNARGGAENCQGTNNALVVEDDGRTKLERWLALEGGEWDVIHFNFGLHDLKRVQAESGRNSNNPDDPHQADPDRYASQLAQIVERLEQTGARLVLATTTPVPTGDLRPYREPADAVLYNERAQAVAAEAGLVVNDLFGYAAPLLPLLQQPENVHFHQEGSEALAYRVVNAVLGVAGHPPVYPGPAD